MKRMKVNKRKLELSMARACMNTAELIKATGMPRPTVNNAITGRDVRPGTLGRIARALGIDVTEILEEEVK